MTLAGIIWDKEIDEEERAYLLVTLYPNRSDKLITLESRKSWKDLLPSTQDELLNLDWSMLLGRDLQPD